MDIEQPSSNGAPRPLPAAVTLELRAPFVRGYVEWLCARLAASLPHEGQALVICDLRLVENPDMETVEGLARLQLTAKRAGCELRLRNASDALRELLDVAGLEEVILLEHSIDPDSQGRGSS